MYKVGEDEVYNWGERKTQAEVMAQAAWEPRLMITGLGEQAGPG